MLKLALFVGIMLALYIFFRLARDDIKLIPLKLTEEKIFDMFFVTLLGAVVGSRILYVLSHIRDLGIDPLKMILFTHFPGLSFIGGVAGGTLTLYLFLRNLGSTNLRVFDLAVLAFLPAVFLGFLSQAMLYPIQLIVLSVLSFFLIKIYRTPLSFRRFNFQGMMFLSFILTTSFLSILTSFAKGNNILLKLVSVEQIVAVLTFTISIYFLMMRIIKSRKIYD